jgi:hypothetical protein
MLSYFFPENFTQCASLTDLGSNDRIPVDIFPASIDPLDLSLQP